MIVEFLEDGYQLVHESGYSASWLSRGEDIFPLTNRDLDSVNRSAFKGEFIQILEKYREKLELKRLVDIAGGAKSECANSIVERFTEVEEVVNIDLVADRGFIRCGKVVPIKANVIDVTKYIENNIVDLAYSSYLFPNLTSSRFDIQTGVINSIAEILKEGGVAIFDENPAYFEIYRRTLKLPEHVYAAGYMNDFVVVSKGIPASYHPALDHLNLTSIPL